MLLPTIGKFVPKPVSWSTLTASVPLTPGATLMMRRSPPALPTDTTLATPPSVEPAPRATELLPVEIALVPNAAPLLAPVAAAPSPKAAPPFVALAAAPTAIEPDAVAPEPMAIAFVPVAAAFWPTATAPACVAWALSPTATEDAPDAFEERPKAAPLAPAPAALVPKTAALLPTAVAPKLADRAFVPTAVGNAKLPVLVPTIGRLWPSVFNCEPLTASFEVVEIVPSATLTIRRCATAVPTETVLA